MISRSLQTYLQLSNQSGVEVIFHHHEAIAAAVERGDADAARRTMAEHLAYSQEVLESLIALASKKTSLSSRK